MAKKLPENGIYKVDRSNVWGAKVLDIRYAEFFVEYANGELEDADAILGRRGLAVPIGPRRPDFSEPLLGEYGVGSGFSPETPKLHARFFVPRLGDDRPLRDPLWEGGAFRDRAWIITARLKSILEEMDAKGWEYWPISSTFRSKSASKPGPDLWLCEMVRIVQSVDNPTPRSDPVSLEQLLPRSDYRFRSRDIGGAQFFRDREAKWYVLCTDKTRRELIAHNVKALSFGLIGVAV